MTTATFPVGSSYGWHFVGDTLRDGSPLPADGVWLPPIYDPIICQRGYHGSRAPFDALLYAPGNTLCLCEYRGEMREEGDKFVASERRIICRMDAVEMLRYFARMQALSVIHLWEAPDVMLDWLMTGDPALRACALTSASVYDSATYARASAYARACASFSACASACASARARACAYARASARASACAYARASTSASAYDSAIASARNEFNALVYECFEGPLFNLTF